MVICTGKHWEEHFLQSFGDFERSVYDINIHSTALFMGGLGIPSSQKIIVLQI